MESLGAMNAFVLSADTGSFTAAAQQLGVTPSAVGKTIARLEEKLGVRLFHRSTRTIALTPEGSLFLERCRRIFSEVEAAEQEIQQTRGDPQGKLRISLPLVGMLMMPTLTAFMHAYPRISVDLDFTDRLVDVIEEGFDAVIRTGEINDSRLMVKALRRYNRRLVASPYYLEKHGCPSTPDDLLTHVCLFHRFPHNGRIEQWPIIDGAAWKNYDFLGSTSSSALEPLIYMVESGLGIASLPDFAVNQQINAGVLVPVLEEHIDQQGTFKVIWPSSRHLSPKTKAFVDYVSQHLITSTDPSSSARLSTSVTT